MNHQDKPASFLDYIRVLPQYIIPQHFLSSLIYRLMRSETPWLKNFLIKTFIQIFKVDMKTSVKPAEEFSHFNDFFTRELKTDARAIEEDNIVSPVDGYISQYGTINRDLLIQAKGHYYRLEELLADETSNDKTFIDGEFTTLYLSPKNYHRIHMPVDAVLKKMIYVPGDLFAVNQHTARTVPDLFARNERVILYFDTAVGEMALIMIGAIFVGSMETVWHGEITPASVRSIQQWQYTEENEKLSFKKGEEIARFNMGSTVILLFPENSIQWNANLQRQQEIIMGEGLAS